LDYREFRSSQSSVFWDPAPHILEPGRRVYETSYGFSQLDNLGPEGKSSSLTTCSFKAFSFMLTLGKGYQELNTKNNVGWLVAKLLDPNLHCAHVMRELVRRHSPAIKLIALESEKSSRERVWDPIPLLHAGHPIFRRTPPPRFSTTRPRSSPETTDPLRAALLQLLHIGRISMSPLRPPLTILPLNLP